MTETTDPTGGGDDLLTCGQVATLFRVAPRTVTRWAVEGRLPIAVTTFGGHRRYRRSDLTPYLTRDVGAAEVESA